MRNIIHIYIYGVLKREFKDKVSITIQDIKKNLKWYIRIPKRYQDEVIKEMVELGLLIKINRDNYVLIPNIKECAPIDSYGTPLW